MTLKGINNFDQLGKLVTKGYNLECIEEGVKVKSMESTPKPLENFIVFKLEDGRTNVCRVDLLDKFYKLVKS